MGGFKKLWKYGRMALDSVVPGLTEARTLGIGNIFGDSVFGGFDSDRAMATAGYASPENETPIWGWVIGGAAVIALFTVFNKKPRWRKKWKVPRFRRSNKRRRRR